MKGLKAVLVAVILLGGLLGRHYILSPAGPVNLKADALAQPIAKSLQTTDSYLPVEGKDFSVENVRYFDSHQWAVAAIRPVGNSADSALIVFKLNNGSWQKILGPGSSFLGADASGLPSDVRKYLGI